GEGEVSSSEDGIIHGLVPVPSSQASIHTSSETNIITKPIIKTLNNNDKYNLNNNNIEDARTHSNEEKKHIDVVTACVSPKPHGVSPSPMRSPSPPVSIHTTPTPTITPTYTPTSSPRTPTAMSPPTISEKGSSSSSSSLSNVGVGLGAGVEAGGILSITPTDSIYENAAKLLFLGVKWARSIPSFMQLPFRDQAILLEESWSELFVVAAAQWALPLDQGSLVRSCGAMGTPEREASLCREVVNMREIIARLHALRVDHTEYACLKALILFKPEARGLRDGYGVEVLQDQTQLMLHEYLASKVIGAGARVRVGKLLLLLPALSQISAQAVQDLFFRKTVGNTPIERVLCDMFKSS
ncbi:unnamed protein product, partial [Meganyctiphanes norvegica]